MKKSLSNWIHDRAKQVTNCTENSFSCSSTLSHFSIKSSISENSYNEEFQISSDESTEKNFESKIEIYLKINQKIFEINHMCFSVLKKENYLVNFKSEILEKIKKLKEDPGIKAIDLLKFQNFVDFSEFKLENYQIYVETFEKTLKNHKNCLKTLKISIKRYSTVQNEQKTLTQKICDEEKLSKSLKLHLNEFSYKKSKILKILKKYQKSNLSIQTLTPTIEKKKQALQSQKKINEEKCEKLKICANRKKELKDQISDCETQKEDLNKKIKNLNCLNAEKVHQNNVRRQ